MIKVSFSFRYWHSCGIVTTPTGKKEYVVAGGNDDWITLDQQGSVEILDLETFEWRDAPDFPTPFYSAHSVPFGDTFLVVGGSSNNDYLKSIYEYDVNSGEFFMRSEILSRPRPGAAASAVSSNYLGCTLN